MTDVIDRAVSAAPRGGDQPAVLTGPQTQALLADGFLKLADMTDPADIAFIRGLIEPLLADPMLWARTTVRELREVANPEYGAPVREIANLTQLEPRLKQSRFFRRAQAISHAVLGDAPQLRHDHIFDKPAYCAQAVDWHQDIAYSGRLTMTTRRLHWWLPLRAVDEDSACMQFVAGSHRRGVQRHWPTSEDGHYKATRGPTQKAPATVCDLPVGGATMHFPRTLHYTGPNMSPLPRAAWIVQFGIRSLPNPF